MCVFFFNDTATTEIYPLSLHDALPICGDATIGKPKSTGSPSAIDTHCLPASSLRKTPKWFCAYSRSRPPRSEEHTSELQSRQYLVCRLLLEKKKSHPTITHLFTAPILP